MVIYVLIVVFSYSSMAREFKDERDCLAAGKFVAESVAKRGSTTITWGCFVK